MAGVLRTAKTCCHKSSKVGEATGVVRCPAVAFGRQSLGRQKLCYFQRWGQHVGTLKKNHWASSAKAYALKIEIDGAYE